MDSLKRPNETVKYLVPRDKQTEKNHALLFRLPTVQNAKKSMTKVGHYRNLRLTLAGDLLETYLDEDGNFVFQNFYLEESPDIQEKKLKTPTASDSFSSFPFEEKDDRLKHVEKKFLIEKFNGKQKAADWLDSFEEECARYSIEENVQKVKCPKLFLQDRAIDWYDATAIKIGKGDWSVWQTSSLKVFASKGWAQVRYAHNFKHLSGSLIEYALKKEKLILEVESRMTVISRINLIVMGLPTYIYSG